MFPNKLQLLDRATPEMKKLVDQAWEDGKYIGRTQAPMFNFHGTRPKVSYPNRRQAIQKLINLPVGMIWWTFLTLCSPFLVTIQVCWFVSQAIWWARDRPYTSRSDDHWFSLPWNESGHCQYLTYWLETTFPKE